MRFRTFFFALIFVVGSLALPLAAHAGIPFFGPIIPNAVVQYEDPVTHKTITTTENVCAAGWGMVITVVNNIIALLITLAIVFVAPLMIAWSGFLFVVNPVDPSGIAKAKSILTNTIVGIVIALAGWMIVDAIMVVLYNPDTPIKDGKLGAWSSLITSGGIPSCIPLTGGLKFAAPPTPPAVTVVPPVDCAASYAATLPGVTVSSSGNCCDKNNRTCTSLDGMLQNTIQQIINVKNKCGAITVTGGTEVGHSGEGTVGSHSGGSKVDIAQNLVSCIEGTAERILITSPSFGSAQVKDRCGNIYTWEGNHTDISIVSSCPF